MSISNSFNPKLKAAADRNIDNCRRCHSRMLRGIEILRSNKMAMLAFRLMNKAMLMQQVHSQSFRFRDLDSTFPELRDEYISGERKWRPFQLAFVLMNIPSATSELDPDRDIVEPNLVPDRRRQDRGIPWACRLYDSDRAASRARNRHRRIDALYTAASHCPAIPTGSHFGACLRRSSSRPRP